MDKQTFALLEASHHCSEGAKYINIGFLPDVIVKTRTQRVLYFGYTQQPQGRHTPYPAQKRHVKKRKTL